MQQQPVSWKPVFNILLFLCIMHQRGLVVPMRKYFGKRALVLPGLLSLGLMTVWAEVSADPFMIVWIIGWGACFIHRGFQSARMEREGAKVSSWYDGFPFETIKIGKTENTAKLVVEPVMVAVLGACLLGIYQECRLGPPGLPWFFLVGGITLPIIEMIKQSILNQRTQNMVDAQIENEAAVREFRNRYGE
jgi:hypothetical protein